MTVFLSERRIKKARKSYRCDASDQIRDLLGYSSFSDIITDEERVIWDKAKTNNFMIQQGEQYLYTVLIVDGDFVATKSIPEVHNLLMKYEIYDE